MYAIEIYLRTSLKNSEVVPNDLDGIEFFIEEVVSQKLLEFFEGVIVKKVVVKVIPQEYELEEMQIRYNP